MCNDEKCSGDPCCSSEGSTVCISLEGAPQELVDLVKAVAQVAVDYPMAVGGVKKRATDARKGLMTIKKLALEMRKSALEKCNAAREKKA